MRAASPVCSVSSGRGSVLRAIDIFHLRNLKENFIGYRRGAHSELHHDERTISEANSVFQSEGNTLRFQKKTLTIYSSVTRSGLATWAPLFGRRLEVRRPSAGAAAAFELGVAEADGRALAACFAAHVARSISFCRRERRSNNNKNRNNNIDNDTNNERNIFSQLTI